MWRPSWILAFCAFPANYLQGCSPRLCLLVYAEIISTGQPFTARHAPQIILAPWYTSEIMSFSTILAALLDLPLKSMFRSIPLGIL